MSDENAPKTAPAMIVAEALRVVPKGARELAGHNVGDVLVDLTQVAREITTWASKLVALPRGAVEFAARAIGRWRKMPAAKRLLPPTPLLLTAATGYAGTSDADLRAAFENLIASAMDVDRAQIVHPSFATSLAAMTPLEARILRAFVPGGSFESTEQLSAALSIAIDAHTFSTAMIHLERLGLIDIETRSPLAEVVDVELPVDSIMGGTISMGRIVMTPMTENNRAASVAIEVYRTYSLTTLGFDLLAVVDPPSNE